MIPINPLLQAPQSQAAAQDPEVLVTRGGLRNFLALMEEDRTWPIWAFLLGSGLRIGELVSLRWSSVDLKTSGCRCVDLVSTLGYD